MTSAPMRDPLADHLITPRRTRAPAQHVPQHHSSGVFA